VHNKSLADNAGLSSFV